MWALKEKNNNLFSNCICCPSPNIGNTTAKVYPIDSLKYYAKTRAHQMEKSLLVCSVIRRYNLPWYLAKNVIRPLGNIWLFVLCFRFFVFHFPSLKTPDDANISNSTFATCLLMSICFHSTQNRIKNSFFISLFFSIFA